MPALTIAAPLTFASIGVAANAETTQAVLERYGISLDSLECLDQEPPGKLQGCQFRKGDLTVHVCFVYESNLLFMWRKGWKKSDVLRATVRRVIEDRSNTEPVDCVFFEPKRAP